MRKINDKSVSHTSTNNALQNGKKNESNIPKDGRFKELQVSFKDLHPEAHQPDVKKNIVIIGDLIIKWKECASWWFSYISTSPWGISGRPD